MPVLEFRGSLGTLFSTMNHLNSGFSHDLDEIGNNVQYSLGNILRLIFYVKTKNANIPSIVKIVCL